MSRRPLLAGILSLLVPGLGQIFAGQGGRGASILFAVIVIGNLNAIWLSLYGLTSPGPDALWTYTLPRILDDLFAAYFVVFYIWQVLDAFLQAKPCATQVAGPSPGGLPT
jgi:TM2 domain-containing membrane protein YozV